MADVPYFFMIQVMPFNFTEFWPLMQTLGEYKKSSSGYDKTKWKLSFQKYIEKLPAYYNDYINSYLKHVEAHDLLLPQTDRVYFHNNNHLTQCVRELKQI